jgi:Ca-activated chloride channel homolog
MRYGLSIGLFVLGLAFIAFGFHQQKYDHAVRDGNYGYALTFKFADRDILTYNMAYKAYQAKNLERAVDLYRQALTLTKSPFFASDIQFNLGVIMEQLKEAEGAAEQYKESLRLNPGNLAAKFNLERLYHLGEVKEGKEGEKSLKQAPGSNKKGDQDGQGQGQGRSGPQSGI